MFSYCYLGCLVYIGWYILGVCSVGGVCGVVCWWCGLLQQLLYYIIFNSYYILLCMVYSGVVWCSGVVQWCGMWGCRGVGVGVCVWCGMYVYILYILYILYYMLCVYCVCICQYHVTHQLVSVCQCVGYYLDTMLTHGTLPPCYSLFTHNINTNKIKKLA